MPHMSSDQLRDISVAVVEQFINSKVPLSLGLAKQAALHSLNSEQVQRCVEASNTVAHLKLLGMAEDRTFEFPLCKYAEVMEHAAAPDMEKSASLFKAVKNTFKDALRKGEAAKAVGSAKKEMDAARSYHADAERMMGTRDPVTDEIHVLAGRARMRDARNNMGKAVHHEADAQRRAVGRIAVGAGATGLAGYAGVKHIKGQEKRAEFEVEAPELSDHERQVYFIKEAAQNDRIVEDLEGRAEAVRAALVKVAAAVAADKHGLDKIACVVDAAIAPQLTALVFGQPTALRDFGAGRDGLFKQAELKPVATMQDLYKEARALVAELEQRRELQKRANVVRENLKKEAFLAAAGGAILKGMGYAVGRTVGTAAKMAASPVVGAGKMGVNKVTNLVTGKGAAPLSMKAKAAIGAGSMAVGIGSNASLLGHKPETNSVTGRSKDVWDSLQS